MRTEINRPEPSRMTDKLALLINAQVTGDTATDLEVASPAFLPGQPIPSRHSANNGNISPQLKWSEAPATVQSYALVMEDPDAPKEVPFVHWLVYNVPASAHQLLEGCGEHPVLQTPLEAVQGTNDNGSIGCFGPRPPRGDDPHRYYFQVLALDKLLQLQAGASRNQLLEAMRGHVVASGSCVGTFKQ